MLTSQRLRPGWSNAVAPLKIQFTPVTSLVSQLPSGWSYASAVLKVISIDVTLLVSQPPMYRLKADANQKVPLRLETELVSHPPMSSLKPCLYTKSCVSSSTRETSQPEMWPCSCSASVGASTHLSTASFSSDSERKMPIAQSPLPKLWKGMLALKSCCSSHPS